MSKAKEKPTSTHSRNMLKPHSNTDNKARYKNIESEHQFKNIIFDDYFKGKNISWEQEIDKIDFVLTNSKSRNDLYSDGKEGASIHYLWAEAKKGVKDIYDMMTQLVLTIKKTIDKTEYIMPPYLGCFDTEKIAFVSSDTVFPVFRLNDFNWNITPSNTDTNDFKKAKEVVKTYIEKHIKIYQFDKYQNEIKEFVKMNIITGKSKNKHEIHKNNFMFVFNKWLKDVKHSIAVNWNDVKKINLIEGDFYLADLLSINNLSLKDKLSVLLVNDVYKMSADVKQAGFQLFAEINFKDKQKAHKQFWEKYKRPPLDEYCEYIIGRRDVLVPQDIRERKGSFFTPPQWVELSQEYLSNVLGTDWQDEYYIWDCAAGTGNLLAGLVNKHNIWASTLDTADVNVMRDRIKNGANLLETHIFQFDFLNDDFDKLPENLRNIINNDEKRKKLVIYINPPYAEAMNRTDATKAKTDVNRTAMEKRYGDLVGKSIRELFIQFLLRIYKEIPGCTIANFSKIKNLQSPNFELFREVFKPKLKKVFLVPAFTFDNVKGQFPIGFFIWDTNEKKAIKEVTADVYDKDVEYIGKKKIHSYSGYKYLNDWLKLFIDTTEDEEDDENEELKAIKKNPLAMCCKGNDFQNNIFVNINFNNVIKGIGNAKGISRFIITKNNLIEACIYFTVRKVIKADWLNDRDQFLFPNDSWKNDIEFHNNCFVYALFNNNIQSEYGVNQWIPYTEKEVNAKDNFRSNFLTDFMAGKIKYTNNELFDELAKKSGKMEFSDEAKDVLSNGKKIWKYYHSFKNVNVNASFYDIKEFFQERDDTGKMNPKSTNDEYTILLAELKLSIKTLVKKIVPKIYEHRFLLR